MSESGARKLLVEKLTSLHAVPIENGSIIKGTPDINYCDGWIELKWLRNWPVRKDTPVKLTHKFTKEQYIWLTKRLRAGGHAWVMLRRRQEWLLMTPDQAKDHLEVSPRETLIDNCTRYWSKGLVVGELIDVLTSKL